VAKKVGLRGARRGIARTMGELAGLKGEEGRVLEDEVGKREEVLATVEGFERKATGLRERIRGIEGEEEARRVEGLTKEEEGLGKEIHEMETRLFEMKARHRHLVREIEGVSNAVQSKLSSYESALQLAERDVRRFLERPPLEGGMRGKGEGVWALPRERRTLEMVGEFYGEEIGGLRGALEGVEKEARALEEGGVVWGAVVGLVDDVEKGLREEMQRMQRPLVEMGEEGGAVAGMRGILQTMRKARLRIEERLEQAERNDWKLLVCCIGAELEALIEGQAVLEGALEAAQGGAMSRDEHGGESSSQENGVGVAEQQLVDDSVPAFSSQDAPSPAQGFLDRSEDEDDGPGPELLISQHDE